MTDEWESPAESASEWLEQATGPWRDRTQAPTTEQLLQAAQVAATLAVHQALERLSPGADA